MNLKNITNRSSLDTINQMHLAIKSYGVYPEDHPITTDIINNSYDALVSHLKAQSTLTLSVLGNKLLVDDLPLESKNDLAASFAFDLEQRAINSISFCQGLSRRDYLIFIKALAKTPLSRSKNGDVASFLRDNDVFTILLNEIAYGKVSGDSTDGPPHPASIRAKNVHDLSKDELFTDDEGLISGSIDAFLSYGKKEDIEALVEGISFKTNNKTSDVRKRFAERLEKVTSTLDKIDTLKDNFQKISDMLITWVKKESDADTYLSLVRSLDNICTSLNKLERYLIDETIGGRMFEVNKLSKPDLQEALKARKNNGASLQYTLAALHLVDETILTHFLAQQYKNYPVVNLSSIGHISDRILKTIPEKYIRRHQILPFKADSVNLHAATINPGDWEVLNDIRFITGRQVVPHLAAEYHLLNAIEKFYNIKTIKPVNHQVAGNLQQEEWSSDLELVEENQEDAAYPEELKDSDAPIIKLANAILSEAIKQNVSDIHIEPYENELRVRLRVDGSLITVLNPSKSYARGLSSRIKIMSGLDISEKRLPQDGRFKVRTEGKCIDFRVSTFPGIFGEKIVLRLLDDSNLALNVKKLGFSKDDLAIILSTIYKTKGMILVTGPTGSGKTTTLYSMLRKLNDGTLNISTAEDPIEYNLKGINQFQMSPKIGLDFPRALRTFLRQDPDIIMVGEIRDLETAEIAFKAALTGHLVLSTLHTNSAPETITRLLNIGIEPYIVAASLNLVIAQRLVRKNCKKCRVETIPTDLQLNVFRSQGFDADGSHFFRGEGCEECSGTGFKGRVAIYEIMPLSANLQELIIKGKSSFEINAKAEELGFTSLQVQGFKKLKAGIIAPSEWIRVLA